MPHAAPALAAVLALTPLAAACPLCDSPTAEAVRAGLVDDDLPRTLAAIVAPFAVVGIVALLLSVAAPARHAAPRDDPR